MEKLNYVHQKPRSFESKFIQFLLGISGFKKRFTRLVIKNKFPKNPAKIPSYITKSNHIREFWHEGRKVWIITPASFDPDKMILYFHGGAYCSNISRLHWAFIHQLLMNTPCGVVVPDYPLAPESACEEVHLFAEHLYLDIQTKFPSAQIILMGDSAGAGLALALAQSLTAADWKKPDQIILLSPWLDVTMSHPDIPLLDKRDKILSIEGLQKAGQFYAGSIDVKDYHVSPIYGNMTGLGRVSVFIGTNDLLLADARRFREILEPAGVGYRFYEYQDMFHDWMLVTRLTEAKDVMLKIAEILKFN